MKKSKPAKNPMDDILKLEKFSLTSGGLLCTDSRWVSLVNDWEYYKFIVESIRLLAEFPEFKTDSQTSRIIPYCISIFDQAIIEKKFVFELAEPLADFESKFADIDNDDVSPTMKKIGTILENVMKFFPIGRSDAEKYGANVFLGVVYTLGQWDNLMEDLRRAEQEPSLETIQQLQTSRAEYSRRIDDHYKTLYERYINYQLEIRQLEEQKKIAIQKSRKFLQATVGLTFRP